MESIALATLPPDPEDMSGDESDFSDQSDESVQDAEENHPREPTPRLFQSKMKGVAKNEGENLYHHNGTVESPILLDDSAEFLDSQGPSSPTLLQDSWVLPPQIMSPATNSPLEYSPSTKYISDYADLVERPPYITTGDRATKKPVGPRNQQRLPGTFASSDESFKLVGHSSLELDNTAREHPLYHNVTPHADGLYHCPWENRPDCQHKPEKLKCNYEYDQISFSPYHYSTLTINFPPANSWILTSSHISVRSTLAKDSSSHLLPNFFVTSVRPTPCMGMETNPSSVLMKAVREVWPEMASHATGISEII
jgi:hypothetical protein